MCTCEIYVTVYLEKEHQERILRKRSSVSPLYSLIPFELSAYGLDSYR